MVIVHYRIYLEFLWIYYDVNQHNAIEQAYVKFGLYQFFLLYFWPPSFPNPDSVPVRIREQTNNNHQQMVGHY